MNNVYLCPGCKFLGKISVCTLKQNLLFCNQCATSDIYSFKTIFSIHSQSGFKCKDCKNFIPKPNNNKTSIICPYPNCLFAGSFLDLKFMKHPYYENNNLVNDNNHYTIKNDNYQLVESAINDRLNYYLYISNIDYTRYHKVSMLESFNNILKNDSQSMIDYLLLQSKSCKIQNKIYKNYISNLESKITISFKKKKCQYFIKSLLDPNLGIFSGISKFDATINNGIIQNGTNEIYVGSRSGYYSQPYYIGKLLDVIEISSNKSVLDKVKDYNFTKIFIDKSLDGMKVNVTHLMIPPHYNIGGMSYLNRIRSELSDILTVKDNNG